MTRWLDLSVPAFHNLMFGWAFRLEKYAARFDSAADDQEKEISQ